MLRNSIILIFFLLFSNVAFAELYKWVDDEGNVHYGDTPPVKNEFEEMKPAPSGNEQEALRLQERTKKILQQQKLVDDSRAKEKQASKKGDSKKLSIEKRCKRAQVELAFYKKPGKHSVLDEEGNLTSVKPVERKQKITKLKSFLDENCQ